MFIQLIINTDANTAELLSDILIDLEALSVTISDEHEGSNLEEAIFTEPGFEPDKLWQHSQLKGLFDSKVNLPALIQSATTLLGKQFDYHIENIADQDWVYLTRSQFNPIKINNKLSIVPSWHTIDNKDSITITLDPGLAFGTGSHPTTFMCLDWISNNVDQGTQSALDYGCGSGILAIACKKFGAQTVYGVDIDDQAIIAAKNNAIINHCSIHTQLASNLKVDTRFEVVIANILSNPLRLLAPHLANLTLNKLALSGILDTQSDELIKIYQEWFSSVYINNSQDGWVLIECIK